MTDYKHRFIILAHRARQKRASKAAANWDPDTGGHSTFEQLTVCRDWGQYPVFAICNTVATDDMKQKIMAALDRGDVDGVYDVGEGWTAEKVMQAVGLKQDPWLSQETP